jgi:hypothetical protein
MLKDGLVDCVGCFEVEEMSRAGDDDEVGIRHEIDDGLSVRR